jgi:putative Holliday junction resolvase
MGFDYGRRRIGVAIGQTVTATASPLTTLNAREGQPDWTRVGALVEEWQPACAVVGLPARADGTPHPLATAIERFGRRLHGRFGLAVEYVDEHLSSHEAAASGAHDAALDALAARLILETWLRERAAKLGTWR